MNAREQYGATVAGLQELLDRRWPQMLVIADAAEDAGDLLLARGWRALAEHRCWPKEYSGEHFWSRGGGGWDRPPARQYLPAPPSTGCPRRRTTPAPAPLTKSGPPPAASPTRWRRPPAPWASGWLRRKGAKVVKEWTRARGERPGGAARAVSQLLRGAPVPLSP